MIWFIIGVTLLVAVLVLSRFERRAAFGFGGRRNDALQILGAALWIAAWAAILTGTFVALAP